MKFLNDIIERLGIARFQKRYVTKKGEEIHVRLIVQATKSLNDEVLFIGLIEDISKLVDYQFKLE